MPSNCSPLYLTQAGQYQCWALAHFRAAAAASLGASPPAAMRLANLVLTLSASRAFAPSTLFCATPLLRSPAAPVDTAQLSFKRLPSDPLQSAVAGAIGSAIAASGCSCSAVMSGRLSGLMFFAEMLLHDCAAAAGAKGAMPVLSLATSACSGCAAAASAGGASDPSSPRAALQASDPVCRPAQHDAPSIQSGGMSTQMRSNPAVAAGCSRGNCRTQPTNRLSAWNLTDTIGACCTPTWGAPGRAAS